MQAPCHTTVCRLCSEAMPADELSPLFTVEEGNAIITEIRSQLPDQAALMGVLDEQYDSAISAISMECIRIGPDRQVWQSRSGAAPAENLARSKQNET